MQKQKKTESQFTNCLAKATFGLFFDKQQNSRLLFAST
jgi:hypothetical protein